MRGTGRRLAMWATKRTMKNMTRKRKRRVVFHTG
jgi:hypothetical protein